MALIVFIIICVSATNIICNEFIFEWLREFIDKHFKYSILNKIIKCETCLGFWIGVIMTFLFPTFGLNWFIGGLISSICTKTYVILLLKF